MFNEGEWELVDYTYEELYELNYGGSKSDK